MNWSDRWFYMANVREDLYGRGGSSAVITSYRRYQGVVSLNAVIHYIEMYDDTSRQRMTATGINEVRKMWDSEPTHPRGRA